MERAGRDVGAFGIVALQPGVGGGGGGGGGVIGNSGAAHQQKRLSSGNEAPGAGSSQGRKCGIKS